MGIFASIKEKITDYVDVNIKLLKLNFIGQSASLFSYLMFALVGLFIGLCILLFAGFGLTVALIGCGLSKPASFFITVGIYFLLLISVYVLRKKIMKFFANAFIRVMTEDEED